jgi:hypothetical protein
VCRCNVSRQLALGRNPTSVPQSHLYYRRLRQVGASCSRGRIHDPPSRWFRGSAEAGAYQHVPAWVRDMIATAVMYLLEPELAVPELLLRRLGSDGEDKGGRCRSDEGARSQQRPVGPVAGLPRSGDEKRPDWVIYPARSPVHTGGVTDLPYFAWNRATAERIQAEIRNSGSASHAEPNQEQEQTSQSGASPASHDA